MELKSDHRLAKFGIVFASCTECGLRGTTLVGNSQGGIVGFYRCTGCGLWDCEVAGAGDSNAQARVLNS
jgi:hypothetical protein